MKESLAITSILSSVAYVIFSILENNHVQNKITNLWIEIELKIEKNKSYISHDVLMSCLNAVYADDNGKFNFYKIFIISFMSHSLVYLSIIFFDFDDFLKEAASEENITYELSLFLLWLLTIAIISLFYEFFAYKLSIFLLNKINNNIYIIIGINVLLIPIIVLLILIGIILINKLLGNNSTVGISLIASNPMAILILLLHFIEVGNISVFQIITIVPAATSIWMPSFLIAIVSTTLKNKKTLRILNSYIELTSNANKLKKACMTIFTLSTGLLGVIMSFQ